MRAACRNSHNHRYFLGVEGLVAFDPAINHRVRIKTDTPNFTSLPSDDYPAEKTDTKTLFPTTNQRDPTLKLFQGLESYDYSDSLP